MKKSVSYRKKHYINKYCLVDKCVVYQIKSRESDITRQKDCIFIHAYDNLH